MEIKYQITEEQYIEFMLKKIKNSKRTHVKTWIMRFVVIAIFGALISNKYLYDIKYYGELKAGASLAILIYIVCMILWIIIFPILHWKINSMIIINKAETFGQNSSEEVTLHIGEEVIKKTKSYTLNIPLTNVVLINEEEHYVYISSINSYDIVIPVKAFTNEENKKSFVDFVKVKIGQPIDKRNVQNKEELSNGDKV